MMIIIDRPAQIKRGLAAGTDDRAFVYDFSQIYDPPRRIDDQIERRPGKVVKK